MKDSHALDHDTARETPSSKHTIAVRTGRSDPPPPHGVPAIRPAAGTPAPRNPTPREPASTRPAGTTSVQASTAIIPHGGGAILLGAAVALLLLAVIAMLATRSLH